MKNKIFKILAFVVLFLGLQSCVVVDKVTQGYLEYKTQKFLGEKGIDYDPQMGEFKKLVENKKFKRFWKQLFGDSGEVYLNIEPFLIDLEYKPSDSVGYTFIHIKQLILKDTLNLSLNQMEKLYRNIAIRLKELDDLRDIDRDRGQLEASMKNGNDYSLVTPCVLVSFNEASFEYFDTGIQLAKGLQINVKVIQDNYQDVHSDVFNLNDNLLTNLPEKVYLKLQSYEGEDFDKLKRTKYKQDYKGQYAVDKYVFVTDYYDSSELIAYESALIAKDDTNVEAEINSN